MSLKNYLAYEKKFGSVLLLKILARSDSLSGLLARLLKDNPKYFMVDYRGNVQY